MHIIPLAAEAIEKRILNLPEDGWHEIADQTYDPNSPNAQSGIAIAGAIENTLKFDEQALDEEQQTQARTNINAASEGSVKLEKAITVQLGDDGTIGGYKTGDEIKEDTDIKTILIKLLQKAVPAKYIKPTLSISNDGGTAGGNIEAGSTITPKLKAIFTKNDAGALDLDTFNILKNDEVAEGAKSITTTTSDGIEIVTLNYTGDSFVIGDSSVTFKASANYADAPDKTNNLGEESKENWFAGGNIKSSDYKIEGKRRLFYGTGAGELPTITSDLVRGLSGTKLAPANGTTFTINVKVGQQYIVIAYPKSLRDIKSIIYVEASNNEMRENFEPSEIKVADARGGTNGTIDYRVYTYALDIPAAATMTFNVTI